MPSFPPPPPPPPLGMDSLTFSRLQITDVTVELPLSSSKWIHSIDVQIDDKNVAGRIKSSGPAETVRTMTLELEPHTVVMSLQVTTHLHYKNVLKKKSRSETNIVEVRSLLRQAKSTSDKT
ncbi:hypothetical protein H0H93_009454, partial [Arthromyces matolae]